MRAFTLDSFDAAPALREDLPTPDPADDQLLVRVQASSVNPVDAFIASGALKGMAEYEFPVVLGRDYAGVVEQVGAAVTRYAAGDEVYGFLLHANPWADTTVLSGDVAAAIGELKAKPGRELQVHGNGALFRWLLDNQLVDEMTLFTCPVVVGQGTRLFPDTGPDRALELVESRATPSGVTIQVYRPTGRPEYSKASSRPRPT